MNVLEVRLMSSNQRIISSFTVLNSLGTVTAGPWFLVRLYQFVDSQSDTYARGGNAKRALENIAGGNVKLSNDDLSDIDHVLS